MALTTFYTPRYRAVDGNGDPLPNAILEFFEAGTSTPLNVYADVDGNTSLGATVTANGSGLFAELFMLPQAYDINLYDENNVLVWSAVDWFPPQAASSANVDLTGTAGENLTAGDLAYLSDGSNSKNAGQWYKADADLVYACVTPQLGFAAANINTGDSGLFRTAGKVTGLSGLTPGAVYYVSNTAAGISATPGTFSRAVGQAESTTVLVAQTNPPVELDLNSVVNGRLTLTTGTPVTTTDVTAATTVYFTPYLGRKVALYSGSIWVIVNFTELSIAVPAVANQVYDVFLDFNDAVPILALTAWTNDTTRATALTTQNGVYVKTGDTQQRYLGTFRTTAVAGQTEDSFAKRYVWNYYNRVPRIMRVLPSTDTWTYTTATLRQANNSTANQLDCVVGVAEVELTADVLVPASNDTGATLLVSIGQDSTTTAMTGVRMIQVTVNASTVNNVAPVMASVRTYPPVGRHFYAWLEYSTASGVTTWYGDGGSPTLIQGGIAGTMQG